MPSSYLFFGNRASVSSTYKCVQYFSAANNSLLFVLLIVFSLIGDGLQFDQQEQGEGVSNMRLKKSNGFTNLSDVPCGRRLARRPKIVGGSDAYQGEFPWLVSVKELTGDLDDTFAHFCGGTILDRRHILSAAHCFEKYFRGNDLLLRLLRVTVGEHDLSTREDADSQDFSVEKLTVHPKFDMRRYSHDVAIIKLDKDIAWSPQVQPACLVNEEFELDSNIKHQQTNATVAGWGSTVDIVGDQPGRFPNVLQKTKLPILDNVECQKWFAHKRVQWGPKDTHLCAGYAEGGFDSCRGDSGGPLMVEMGPDENDGGGSGSGSDLAVIGIVAAGKGCARPFLPGVYTRVSKFVDWISENVAR